MTNERIHRADSADGTEIAGRVHGQGPPVVLVHGAPHDGDIAWEALVPHLVDRFTCFLPSLRGRGLSDDSPDHSPPRLQEDVNAFVDSIGEPLFLVGWSAGVPRTLAAAAHSGAVVAVATFEPTIIPVMGVDDSALRGAMYVQFGQAAADGRPADAARAFHDFICTDNEIAALDEDYFERCAAVVPAMLKDGRQGASYDGPLSTDPQVFGKVATPVLLLRGQQTQLDTFYTGTERHVADHVADPHVREPLPGGHLAPLLAPEPIAKELTSFFEWVQLPA
ncbi:MAG TPA: alpha/beta hydrolase [Acidimicrobiia bacterium]|nr:alpha/beta hydrolase [Acidimicrobiia bacterium]